MIAEGHAMRWAAGPVDSLSYVITSHLAPRDHVPSEDHEYSRDQGLGMSRMPLPPFLHLLSRLLPSISPLFLKWEAISLRVLHFVCKCCYIKNHNSTDSMALPRAVHGNCFNVAQVLILARRERKNVDPGREHRKTSRTNFASPM